MVVAIQQKAVHRLASVRWQPSRGKRRTRLVQEGMEARISREACRFLEIHQDLQKPVRLAAQAEWIARAGRPLAGEEQADDRVELVCERHGGPSGRGRAQLRTRWR